MKILKFKEFIVENINISDQYKEEFFNDVQENIKSILLAKGSSNKDVNSFVNDMITQNQNKVKNLIDLLTKDGTITPHMVAQQIIDKWYKSTQFNNVGDLPDSNKIVGDRGINSMD